MKNKTLVLVVVIVAAVLSVPILVKLKGGGSQTGNSKMDPNAPSSAFYEGKEVKTSALGAALLSGERNKVLDFVRAGADLNNSTTVSLAAGDAGLHYTVWHIAFLTVLSGKATVDFLQFLFDNGADPLAACPPLDYAFPTPPLLVLFSHWDSPKFDAVGNAIGELLIQKGNDVNAQLVGPKSSIPLLNFMVTLKNESAVRFLLSHGAKPNSTGSDGFTALGQAKRKSWTEIVPLLQQHGATE